MNFSVQAIYNWYRDTIRNPKYRWWIILGTLAYLISPIDIAPDFIPFIGWIDDGVILTLLISEVSQLMTEKLRTRQRPEAEQPIAHTDSEATVDVNAVPLK
ncbi:MAG: YkvA family protein [Leptolyngbyaceae bacterium]|nr:YkvA family protein [Leptolyngbyaceae bacterium]